MREISPAEETTMSHWHVYRITAAGEINIETKTLDLDIEFYRDHFPSARLAAHAMAKDIACRYPQARRIPSFRSIPTTIGANPHSTFRFNTERGELVMWYLLECAGRCEATFLQTGQNVRKYLSKRVGLPATG